MAKKFAAKNKVVGIKKTTKIPPVIRWINAFTKPQDRGFSAVEMAKYETETAKQGKQVSAEPCWSGFSSVLYRNHWTNFGLLIDVNNTKLFRCYAIDAYSVYTDGVYISKRKSAPFVKSWNEIQGLKKLNRFNWNGKFKWQGEAVVSNPTYTAVVYRKLDDEVIEFAKAMNLPLVNFKEV